MAKITPRIASSEQLDDDKTDAICGDFNRLAGAEKCIVWRRSGGGCNDRKPEAEVPRSFVSGNAHSDTHVYDAATAATCFSLNENNLDQVNAVTAERPLSLIGSAALWSGWTNNVAALHSPSLVIMPAEPYKGPLKPV